MNKVFVDFEWHPMDKTYWENPYVSDNEIIQFGAIMLDNDNKEIKRFNKLVKPEYNDGYSNFILDLTHINKDDLENSNYFKVVLKEFVEWCGNDYQIYSWSDNDSYQIKKEINYKYITVTDKINYMLNNWIDYQIEFDNQIGIYSRLALVDALEMFNIEGEGIAHDALDDAVNMAKLYQYSIDKNNKDKFTKIEDLNDPNESKDCIGDLFDKDLLLSKLDL